MAAPEAPKSGVHVAIDDASPATQPEQRPSAEKIPSMRDIILQERVSQFGTFSYGGLEKNRKSNPSLGGAAAPPKFRSLLVPGGGGDGTVTHEASLELLHRYNILLLRTKLLLSLRSETALLDQGTSDKVFDDLGRYSSALRDYESFRSAGRHLFPSSDADLDKVVVEMANLETAQKKRQACSAAEESARRADEEAAAAALGNAFLRIVQSTTSGLSSDKSTAAAEALWARLFMALGGGLALVGPMLIMVLRPTKTVALATTSCFVVGVAVLLAIFMRDSQPKDVLACTAAYAAVLVVFVGAGGGA